MQTSEKTTWFSYIATAVGFFILLFIFDGIVILFVPDTDYTKFFKFFVILGIVTLLIGLFFSMVMNRVAKSSKSFVWAHSIVSFLFAALVSIWFSIIIRLNDTLEKLTVSSGEAGQQVGLVGLFPNPPNPLLTGLIIVISFNLFAWIMWIKEQGPVKDLFPYAYSLIAFLLLYFVASPLLFALGR